MKRLNKIVVVLTAILEIISWVFAATSVLSLCATLFNPKSLYPSLLLQLNASALRSAVVSWISASAESVIAALVLRCLRLVLRVSQGKTKRSLGETPFQPVNVRLLRRAGILCILNTLLKMALSIILSIVSRSGTISMHLAFVDLLVLGVGLALLCLAGHYAYGARLEAERAATAVSPFPGRYALRLDDALARRGITLTDLAAHLDIPNQDMHRMADNEAIPREFATVLRICEVLNCAPSNILARTDGD